MPTLICAKEAAGMANMMAASKTVLIEWRMVVLSPKYAFGCEWFYKEVEVEHCKDKPPPAPKVAFGRQASFGQHEDVG